MLLWYFDDEARLILAIPPASSVSHLKSICHKGYWSVCALNIAIAAFAQMPDTLYTVYPRGPIVNNTRCLTQD